jgi:acyl dehydratase
MSKTVYQINVGDSAYQTKVITEHDIELFGQVSNDYNPAHFDAEYAAGTMFKKRIAHGMLVGSLFSKVFGMDLPGKGAIYIGQTLKFKRPVYFGDEIKAEVIVREKNIERNRVYFDCVATNQNGDVVIKGEAELMPVKE